MTRADNLIACHFKRIMHVKRQIDNQYCLLGAIFLLCNSPMTQLFHQTNILFHTGNAIRDVIHYQMCVGRGGGWILFCGGGGGSETVSVIYWGSGVRIANSWNRGWGVIHFSRHMGEAGERVSIQFL